MQKIIPVTIDTREQAPFLFFGYPVKTETGTLHTGDYTIPGMSICVERKSLSDLCGCMTTGRNRFERELERMREFDAACVVVEEPLAAIRHGEYRSKLNPVSFEQSILSLMVRYRVPFLFGHDRRHAEYLAFNCLRHVWNKAVPNGARVEFIPYQ